MRLDHTIAKRFTSEELAALAAELDVEAHDPGAAPAALTTALAAHGRAAALLAALAARAPDVAWAALEWPPAALAALHDALDRRLDADGLRDLCLGLGVDPDNLAGETKRARARELVRAMARAGRVGELGIGNYELGIRNGGATSDERRVTSQERRASSSAAPPVARPASEDADSATTTRHAPPAPRRWPFVTRRSPLVAADSPPTTRHQRLVTRRSLLVTLFCILAAFLFWRVWATSGVWGASSYPPPAIADAPLTVAVAEFAETADCRRGAGGREAGALVYETLARELAAAGLGRRVALTRVGRVCDTAAAVAAGQEAGAAVVVWGWLPQTTDGLFAEFTLVDAAAPVSADLARSFEALFTGPGEALSLQLSGRAVVLSRFLLGLLHAAQGEHAAAETLLGAAIAAVEAEMAADTGGAAELRRTLAVLLTERGKARAALGRADEARADFDAAERLNPDYLRLLVARAAEAYGRRDWAAARRYLDRAALQDEPLPTIAYGYGLLDYYDGQYTAAVAHFNRALALVAGLPDAGGAAVYRLARGYSYVALGDCGAAATDFAAAAADPAAPAEVAAAAGGAVCGSAGELVSAGAQGSGGAGEEDPLPNPLPEGAGAVGAGGEDPLLNPFSEGEGTIGVGMEDPLPNPLPEGEGGVGVGGRPVAEAGPRLSPQQMAAAALPEATSTPSNNICPTPSSLPCSPAPLLPCASSPPCTPAPLPPCASCTATPGPLLLQVGTRGANLRRGPGPEYPVVATRRAGAQLEALAANVSGEWLQVRVPGQGRGWVSAAFVTAQGEVGGLGVVGVVAEAAGQATATRATVATATAGWPGAARPVVTPTPSPAWTPPGHATPSRPATATAPAPPAAPLPTLTPPAPQMPTATLLPPPTARAGGRP